VIHRGERNTAEALGDEGRLAFAAGRQGAVRHAVLGILLFSVTHEVEVVGQNGWFLRI
jgi:hypothetical protein